MDKVLERDSKLSELDNRADALQAGASQFETNAGKLKRKMWWQNCKVSPPYAFIMVAKFEFPKFTKISFHQNFFT